MNTSRPPSQFQQFDSTQYDNGDAAGSTGAHAAQVDFEAVYREAPYFSAGRNWNDYAPAYRYGEVSQRLHADKHFEDVEDQLADNWDSARDGSRLGWVEARGAVQDAWRVSETVALQGGHDDGGQQTG